MFAAPGALSETGGFGPSPNVPRSQAPDPSPTIQRVSHIMGCGDVEWSRGRTIAPAHPGIPVKPGAQTAVSVLRRSAESDDVETRLRALEGLARSGESSSIDAFLDALSDPSEEIRTLAGQFLAKCDANAVCEKVLLDLADPFSDAFAATSEVLPELKELIEDELLRVMQSDTESSQRRMAAAYALGRIGTVGAIPSLAELAWSGNDALSVTCANALCSIRDPLVLSALVRLVEYPVRDVQIASLAAMVAVGGKEPMEALAHVAVEPPNQDSELSRCAVRLMGASGDEQVVPLLVDVLQKNGEVRGAAVQALRQLTGEYAGDTGQDWAEWYQRKLESAARGPEESGEGLVEIGSLPAE